MKKEKSYFELTEEYQRLLNYSSYLERNHCKLSSKYGKPWWDEKYKVTIREIHNHAKTLGIED